MNKMGIKLVGGLSMHSSWQNDDDNALSEDLLVKKELHKILSRWIKPHLKRGNLIELVYEFMYHYNSERKNRFGWRLINPLLEAFLSQV